MPIRMPNARSFLPCSNGGLDPKEIKTQFSGQMGKALAGVAVAQAAETAAACRS
jgi:hypothetical protein